MLAILVRIDRHVVKAGLGSLHMLPKYGWLIIPLANKLDLEITRLRQCRHAIWCLRWTSTIHCTVALWTLDGTIWADPCRSDQVHTCDLEIRHNPSRQHKMTTDGPHVRHHIQFPTMAYTMIHD